MRRRVPLHGYMSTYTFGMSQSRRNDMRRYYRSLRRQFGRQQAKATIVRSLMEVTS